MTDTVIEVLVEGPQGPPGEVNAESIAAAAAAVAAAEATAADRTAAAASAASAASDASATATNAGIAQTAATAAAASAAAAVVDYEYVNGRLTGLPLQPPLAYGARIAGVGSSSMQANSGALSSTLMVTSASGFVTRARLLDPRFEFDSWYDATKPNNVGGANKGVGGTTYAAQVTQIEAALSEDYAAIVLYTGPNELVSLTPQVAFAGIRDNVQRVLDGGAIPILCTPNARGTSGANALAANSVDRRKKMSLDDKLRDFAAQTSGVYLADLATAFADPTSAMQEALADTTLDGLHALPLGVTADSLVFLDAIRRVVQPRPDADFSGTNLYQNGNLTGTGGNNGVATTLSGTLPSYVRVGCSGGTPSSSAVASTITDPSGKAGVRVLITAADETPVTWWTLFSDTSGSGNSSIAASAYDGQWVRAEALVWLYTGGELLRGWSPQVESRTSSTGAATSAVSSNYVADLTTPIGDVRLNGHPYYFRTPPFQIPSGTTHLNFKHICSHVGTGSILYEVSRPTLYVVDDPRV